MPSLKMSFTLDSLSCSYKTPSRCEKFFLDKWIWTATQLNFK